MSEFLLNCPVCKNTAVNVVVTCRDYLVTKENFSIQECKGCKIRFTNPRPAEHEIKGYYQSERYISHDSGNPDLFTWIYRRARRYNIRKKFLLMTRFHKGNAILDIGCGTGEFLQYCREKEFLCLGIEPNDKARDSGILRYGLSIAESLEKISRNAKFDIITLWHVLEHFHDPVRLLDNLSEMLNDDGILVIALPNHNSFDAGHYGEYWAAYDVPRHLFHFSRGSFQYLYTNSGYECLAVYPQLPDAFYISILSERNREKRFAVVSGMWNGLRSNFLAKCKNRGTSSLIYILKLKNPK